MNSNEVLQCFWCGMPKARKGILLGVLASSAIHLTAVAALTQIAQNTTIASQQKIHVIELGTVETDDPRNQADISTAREM